MRFGESWGKQYRSHDLYSRLSPHWLNNEVYSKSNPKGYLTNLFSFQVTVFSLKLLRSEVIEGCLSAPLSS